jgi:hypothetical protein
VEIASAEPAGVEVASELHLARPPRPVGAALEAVVGTPLADAPDDLDERVLRVNPEIGIVRPRQRSPGHST